MVHHSDQVQRDGLQKTGITAWIAFYKLSPPCWGRWSHAAGPRHHSPGPARTRAGTQPWASPCSPAQLTSTHLFLMSCMLWSPAKSSQELKDDPAPWTVKNTTPSLNLSRSPWNIPGGSFTLGCAGFSIPWSLQKRDNNLHLQFPYLNINSQGSNNIQVDNIRLGWIVRVLHFYNFL